MKRKIYVRDVMAKMNVNIKVIGIKRWAMRLRVAGWFVKLGCRVGGLVYAREDESKSYIIAKIDDVRDDPVLADISKSLVRLEKHYGHWSENEKDKKAPFHQLHFIDISQGGIEKEVAAIRAILGEQNDG